MADKNVTQTQHEQVERFAALLDEAGKAQAKWIEQNTAAINQMAEMMKQSLAYGAQLSADWRKVTVEAAKRTSELFGKA